MEPVGRLDGLVIDCSDTLALARFWAAVFATEVIAVDGDPPQYVDLAPRDGVPTLRFQRVPEGKQGKNRLHLDIEVASLDDAVARIVALGGRAIQERRRELGVAFRIAVDPEGNELCLIEPEA